MFGLETGVIDTSFKSALGKYLWTQRVGRYVFG